MRNVNGIFDLTWLIFEITLYVNTNLLLCA